MLNTNIKSGFTLVELLATIAIMAVLIVAALPYVADYTAWARTTSEMRDAQVVQGAISRWIAVGADVTGSGNQSGQRSKYNWIKCTFGTTFRGAHAAASIIKDLVAGWTVVPNSGNRDPFLAPNTSYTQLGGRIRIGFTTSRSYTVAARSE